MGKNIENKQPVLKAVKKNGEALKNFPEFQNDRDIVLEAVRENAWALQYASEALRGDREIVLAAVRQIEGTLEFASYELRADPEFILLVV